MMYFIKNMARQLVALIAIHRLPTLFTLYSAGVVVMKIGLENAASFLILVQLMACLLLFYFLIVNRKCPNATLYTVFIFIGILDLFTTIGLTGFSAEKFIQYEMNKAIVLLISDNNILLSFFFIITFKLSFHLIFPSIILLIPVMNDLGASWENDCFELNEKDKSKTIREKIDLYFCIKKKLSDFVLYGDNSIGAHSLDYIKNEASIQLYIVQMIYIAVVINNLIGLFTFTFKIRIADYQAYYWMIAMVIIGIVRRKYAKTLRTAYSTKLERYLEYK